MRKTIFAAAVGLSFALAATAALADRAMKELTPQPEQMTQPISVCQSLQFYQFQHKNCCTAVARNSCSLAVNINLWQPLDLAE